MASLIVTLGLISLIAGITLTTAAFRGRWIDRNPYCKGCGFDLTGLDLTEPANCPECGRTVRSGTESIKIGKRKRRPILVVAGLLLALLGTTGVAWPRIAQLPSIRNFDWYAHLPESMLLSLEANGNKKALAELHSRLIPGELSNDGLHKLIDRSLSMFEDELVPWNALWGDVLLYGFLTEQLTDDQLATYVLGSLITELEFKDQSSTDEGYLHFQRSARRSERGLASHQFRDELIQSGIAHGSAHNIKSQYTLTLDRVILRDETQTLMEDNRASLGSGKSETEWTPFSYGANVTTYQRTRLPASQPGKQTITVEYHFSLLSPRNKSHQWVSCASKVLTRVNNPKYADFIEDREVLARQLGQIEISELLIPSDPEAIQASGEGGVNRGIFQIYNQTDPPLGFCGEIVFLNGEQRLSFTTASFSGSGSSGVGVHSVRGYPNRWWEYFIEHETFFESVKQRGHIDILILPDRGAAEQYIGISSEDRIVGHHVVFRNVPVQFYKAISDEPWDAKSPRSIATSGRREQAGVVQPELFDEDDRP